MAEFFAGRGNLSRCMRLSGIPTASLDLLYPAVPRKSNPNRHTINAMDMNTPAGFAPFGRGRLSIFLILWFLVFQQNFWQGIYVCSLVWHSFYMGIAATVSRTIGSTFLAGVWMDCGLGQICWYAGMLDSSPFVVWMWDLWFLNWI